MAIEALRFLSEQPNRLIRFMQLSGVEPAELVAKATQPGLQAAILAHLMSDESLLLVFTSETGLAPERIAPAQALLAQANG